MSVGAIPLRDYVTSGLVSVEVVNALLAFGEPMLSETVPEDWDVFPYRAWLRCRAGGRTFGQPAPTVRLAADNLLAKLRGGR